MFKKLAITFGVLGLLSTGMGVYDYFQPNVFQKSLTKVTGTYGHGSGHIIDTNGTKSLILTNKHVCDGLTVDSNLNKMLEFLTFHTDTHPECATFQCIGKKDPMFGPHFLQLLVGVVDYLDVSDKYVHNYLAKLQNVIFKQSKFPVTIIFNNLDIEPIKSINKVTSLNYDLCLVTIPIGGLPIIKLADNDVKKFERIQTHGNPSFLVNSMTEGFVGDYQWIRGGKYQHHSAIIYGGSSGSGSFNMDGELIGVNTLSSSHSTVQTGSWIVPLEHIKDFIDGRLFKRPEGNHKFIPRVVKYKKFIIRIVITVEE